MFLLKDTEKKRGRKKKKKKNARKTTPPSSFALGGGGGGGVLLDVYSKIASQFYLEIAKLINPFWYQLGYDSFTLKS